MDTPKKIFGMYSALSAEIFGTCFYATPDGKEVEITMATSHPDDYFWEDKVNKGEVTHFIRKGETGSCEFDIDEIEREEDYYGHDYGYDYDYQYDDYGRYDDNDEGSDVGMF